jgi:hypothetical protein
MESGIRCISEVRCNSCRYVFHFLCDLAVFDDFIHPHMYSPSVQAEELPESHPEHHEVVTLQRSETAPQSLHHQSPPQSPPPSYAIQGDSAGDLPEWQLAAQPMQWAQSGGSFDTPYLFRSHESALGSNYHHYRKLYLFPAL